MTSSPDTFVKIATIAESVGAADIAESARACVRPDHPEKILVVHWSSTASTSFCDWLERELQPNSVTSAVTDSVNIQWFTLSVNWRCSSTS